MEPSKLVVAAFAVALPTGCAADQQPAASPRPAATLQETCPLIEAGLPPGPLPPAKQWKAYAAELRQLAAAGDVETQNAIAVLVKPVKALAADPRSGEKLLDARASLRSALNTVAGRCRAVGSSALQ